MLVEDGGDPDTWAHVAHVTVCVGCGAPVGACVRELFGLGVEVVDLGKLGGGELDEVVFEEVIHIVVVVDILRGKDCAFIRDIAMLC